MDIEWNKRLKEARIKNNLTMKDCCSRENLNISEQSLIKYEKGEIFPRIDLLEKMSHLYNVSIPFILYGESELSKTNDLSGQLVSLFSLLYSHKLYFSETDCSLKIVDQTLLVKIRALALFIEREEIASTDDLIRLIQGIKKMSSEK